MSNINEEESNAAGLQNEATNSGTGPADSELVSAPAHSRISKQPEPTKFSNRCVEQLLRAEAAKRSLPACLTDAPIDVEHYKDQIYNFEGSNDKSVIRCKFFDREDFEEDEYNAKLKAAQTVESKAQPEAGARTWYLMQSEVKSYNYLGKGQRNLQFKNLDDAGSTL